MLKPYLRIANTKEITDEQWKELRTTGLGGSDAGAVVGLNPYSSQYTVYHEKLKIVQPWEGNDKTRLGKDLEEYVAKRFEEETGKRVRRFNSMLRSIERPYMIADVDRLIVGEDAGLECKTTTNNDNYDFENGEYPAYWGCQCYHYMSVTGLKVWYLAVLDLSDGKFYCFKIDWDESEIKALEKIEEDFWTNCIEQKCPPTPNGSDKCADIIKEKYPESDSSLPIADVSVFDSDVKRYVELRNKIKELTVDMEAIGQKVKDFLGVSPGGESALYKISYKSSVSKRLDSTLLKKEMPDIWEAYAKESVSRKFLVNEKKI